ncbi:MAG: hypothetical protein EOO77_16280 [Oxalobacteraceae bacterium]|nr:MAG: hypothetical protein EOO77_16280 [Oxalobacteraceae bacterium]
MKARYKKIRRKLLAELVVLRSIVTRAQAERQTDTVMASGMKLWEVQMELARLRRTRQINTSR